MRKFLIASLFLTFSLCWMNLSAQKSIDLAVLVSAKVYKNPNKIVLRWTAKTGNGSYYIYRKPVTTTNWGIPIATLPANATTYTDTSGIKVGQVYEYQLQTIFTSASIGYYAFGYITAGMEIPSVADRGEILLLVDDSCATKLSSEVKRLEWDLIGDGWSVVRRDVKRSDKVSFIKSMILMEYNKNKTRLKSIFLLGHVPVPYSGTFGPDGHSDHQGAWPADMYYGDIDGVWTDSATAITASRIQNKNYPNDGKFDDDVIPSAIELEVGRVDLSDMPLFPESETTLMKRYLDRDHDFRTGKLKVKDRGILEDNFGFFGGEAFASSGYKAMAPMFGDSNITTGDYLDIRKNEYKFSYGTGGGNYKGASGIAGTDSFSKPTDTLKTVFTMLFGSYFGDWDSQDNFLRAPLAAKGYCLTNVWSGRPQWILHQMALGANIGACAKISFQDNTTYFRHLNAIYGKTRQTALMGDPTLRLNHLSTIKGLKLVKLEDSIKNTTSVKLTWNKTKDNVSGYRVYRTRNVLAPFVEITSNLITDTFYTENNPPQGSWYYMVRGEGLQLTASGSYFNLSKGLVDSTVVKFSSVGIEEDKKGVESVLVYPNPAQNYVIIEPDGMQVDNIRIMNTAGQLLLKSEKGTDNARMIDISMLSNGIYILQVDLHNGMMISKKMIIGR